MVNYAIVGNADGRTIVVFANGQTLVAAEDHPNWDTIVSLAEAGDESVVDHFDLAKTVATRFEPLTERVSTRNGKLYLDGDEIHNALTNHILRYFEEDDDRWLDLVAFMENVQANPDEHSREQLYEWLDRHAFTITGDGLIVGYKGVNKTSDGEYVSTRSGPAIVDGEEVNGYVPNNPGSVIEMPRSSVVHDPSVGCSVGLHVGTYDYASNFTSHVLEVHVNPRDVVSVPTDSDWAKVRCCRYTVIGEVERPYTTPSLPREEPVDEEDDYDMCPECGEYQEYDCACHDEDTDEGDYEGDPDNYTPFGFFGFK
jgi:hypothetical protein